MSNLTDKLRAAERRHSDKILGDIGALPTYPNKHAVCPLPGHDDNNPSFRYDPEAERCFCSCRPNGITLTDVVAEIRGVNTGDKTGFVNAVKAVEQITGEQILEKRVNGAARVNGSKPTPEQEAAAAKLAEEKAEREKQQQAEVAAKSRWIESELQRLEPITGTPVETYLRQHRGLTDMELDFPNLGFMPDFRTKPGGKVSPAMVAVVRDSSGKITGMAGTLLNSDGSPKRDAKGNKIKLSCGSLKDGFVTLRHPAAACVAIAEGIETGLSRIAAGPAEVRVCVGIIRTSACENATGRVEFISDVDQIVRTRQLAREQAKNNRNIKAYVIAPPASFGAKADLNDVLMEMNAERVLGLVDDGDRIRAARKHSGVEQLTIGSDVEVSDRVLEQLEDLHGNIAFAEGAAWAFNGRIWEALDENRLKRHVQRFDGAIYPTASGKDARYSLTSGKVKSVIELLYTKRSDEDFFTSSPTGVSCRNCFVSVRPLPGGEWTATAEPHARNQRARHYVNADWHQERPADFDHRLKASDLNRFLRGLFSSAKTLERIQREQPHLNFTQETAGKDVRDRIRAILEVAACAILGHGTRLSHPKAAIFVGQGGSGKSTVGELLCALIDPKSVSSVPPSVMGERFGMPALRGAALNYAEEVSSKALGGDVFKRVVTGNICNAEPKNKDAFYFRPTAQHLFITNKVPTFAGGVDTGLERRVLIIPFDNRYADTADKVAIGDYDALADRNLLQKIVDNDLDLFLALVIDAGLGLLKAGALTEPETAKIAKNDWLDDSDRVRAWARRHLVVQANSKLTVEDAYNAFRDWWADEGLSVGMPAKNSFSFRLSNHEPALKRGPDSVKAHFINAKLK
ncbi:DNA primase family protein [Ruegeria arenilitoris]|uniref:DNA primase family protein n=1 Tax=Ruegeria arenilitoris TaxID=1173585 RepID=UPI001479C674|nr:DUF5906 domain-containing protein [Ruegeria arenilitoris]